MNSKLVGMAGLLGLIFLFPTSLNADLGSFQYRIIKVAFMNGYVRAIGSDADTIQSLKENEDYLKMYVDMQARRYMQEVADLNQGIPVRQGIDEPEAVNAAKTFRRNTTW